MGEKTKIILENIGKNKDKNQGVWCSQEYQDNNWKEMQFLANNNYFLSDVREQMAGCFIAKTDTKYKSSQILNAFLKGPTIADCGSTVMAAQYRALEELIGTDEFDRIFDNKIAPFSITNNLWNMNNIGNKKLYYTSFNPIYIKTRSCQTQILFYREKDKYQKPWHKTETEELSKAQNDIDYHANITKICKIPKENEVNMIDADVLCDMTCAHKLETDLTDEIKQKSNLVGIRCLESNSFCCEVTNTILEYIIYNFATKQFLTREERDNLYGI